ncbi:MAG: hypothetical protein AAB421_01690 [Patescibacteria group bacterium]
MKNLWSYKKMVVWILCIVTASALGGAGWMTWYIRSSQKSIEDMAFVSGEEMNRVREGAVVRAVLRDTKMNRAKLAAITKEREPIEDIRSIESAAEQVGTALVIEAVSPSGGTAEDASLESYLITMTVEGTFSSIHHFISMLETLPLPSSVEQIKIEAIEQGWRGSIIVKIYIEAA